MTESAATNPAPRVLAVPEALAQQILSYLHSRPYGEVREIAPAFEACQLVTLALQPAADAAPDKE